MILFSVIVKARVTMRIAEYFLILCSLFLNGYGLDCRSEGGLKEKDLKNIYNICMKQNKSKTNNDGEIDQDWRETRRYNQWSEDNMDNNRGSSNNGYGMGGHDKRNRMDNSDRTEDRHKMSRQDERSNNRDNRMEHRDRDEEEDRYSRRDKQNNNGDNRSQKNNGVNGRNDFFQNENYGGHSNNQYSTQSPRRYKRERRVEVNSGKRSQYNPNSQRSYGYEDKYKDEGKNSSESNSTNDDNSNACAMHCLLEKLKMTDERGMPDRYLVTHKITGGVKDEDLNDFLQEAIEECFQILDNENNDDKCEFSKNLLMCLSEKGRANCDDWKDNFQF